jgi:hypothetical protein
MLRAAWTGLAEVVVEDPVYELPPGQCGFVNLSVMAEDALSARKQMSLALRDIGFRVLVIENVRRWTARRADARDSASAVLASQAQHTGEPQYGDIHIWPVGDPGE